MVQHPTAMVPPSRGGISPTQTAEGWWWPSTQTQIQAMIATYLHVVTAVKVHCKPLLKGHCPPPWSVSSPEHRAQQGNCCHTHLQSPSAFCIVQSQSRPNWALCPAPGTLLLKELSCHPSFAQLLSHNLDPQTSNLPRQAILDVSKTCWITPHPLPLVILAVFGFIKLYFCSTMAWYCLVNHVQSTDQLWPFTACTTEGLCIWRNHQPFKSLSYQQQSLYSLPRES